MITLIIISVLLFFLFLVFKKKESKSFDSKPINSNSKENELEVSWNNWNEKFDSENSTEPLRTFITKVVGVSYQNNNGSNRQSIISKCRQNEKLLLIPELYKGKYAISVCRENFEQLGYLNSELAEEISDLITRRKSKVDAKVSSINGGGTKTLGVNIEIQKYVNNNRQKPIPKETITEKAYDSNIKMHRLSYQRNIQAYELEQNGYIENAI